MKLENMSSTRKIAVSGMIMALYIVVMYFTQTFAFGQYQVRIATAIYATAYLCPFLTFPLALSNLLANMLMGGLGVFDIVGGGMVGLLTAGSCALLRRANLSPLLTAIPIAVIPALLVSTWLSSILGISYFVMVCSLGVGQVIAGVFGSILVKALAKAFGIEHKTCEV